MNKRGKLFGIIGASVLFVLVFATLVFTLKGSSAIIQKDVYSLGENVKIDLAGISDYRMKITTPSTSYLATEQKETYVFKPEEVGHYKITLTYGDKSEDYEFEVVELVQEPEVRGEESPIQKPESEEQKVEVEEKEELERDSQGRPVVGEDFRWRVREPVRRENGKAIVKVPSQGFGFEVFGGEGEKINFEIQNNLLTNAFSRAVSLNKDFGEKTLVFDYSGENVLVEYFTEAPEKEEKDISVLEKEVKVSSGAGLRYENVLSFAEIPEFTDNENYIEIYWVEEDENLKFEAFDKDENGVFDYIEWEIPHLSEQTFRISVREDEDILDFNFDGDNTFKAGNKIKFDMRNLGSYEIEIFGPETTIKRIGSNDFFLFVPLKTGSYEVKLKRGGGTRVYEFAVTKEDVQGEAEIGQPVRWIREVDGVEEEYFTDPPFLTEKVLNDNVKEVKVSSPPDVHYENVLSYVSIEERVKNANKVKVYWVEEGIYLDAEAEDLDGNGYYDFVSWIAPHLSEQTFLIIVITTAEHLDSSRMFIEDVYPEVSSRDGIFKEVPAGDYVRVTFEKNLTNVNDITIYAKSSGGGVEVYEKDENVKIADFGTIIDDQKYRILLTDLIGEQDTFDLKVVNAAVDFDLIIDPPEDGLTLVFNDTLTDTSGTLMTAHTPNLGDAWDEVYSDASNAIITGNALDGNGGNSDGAVVVGDISRRWGYNQMVKATYSAQATGDDYSHLVLRSDSTMSQAYVFTFTADAATTYIWRRLNATTNTQLNTSCGPNNQFTTGDVISFLANGTRLSVFDGNTLVCTVVDTNIRSGRPGAGTGSSYFDTAGDTQGQRLDNILLYTTSAVPEIGNYTNGMELVINDTFTASDGTDLYNAHSPNLGLGWVEVYDDASNLIILSNELDADNAADDGSFGVGRISRAWGYDQMVQAEYTEEDSGDDLLHLVLRADYAAEEMYVFSFSTTGANTQIWRRTDATTNTVLNASCGDDLTFLMDDVITFRAIGTSLAVFRNNVTICTATDSNIISGRAGVGLGSSYLTTAGDQDLQRLDNVLIYTSSAPNITGLTLGWNLVFNDTFTDTNGDSIYTAHNPDLGVGWIEIYSDASDLIVTSNELDGDNAGDDGSFGVGNISGNWKSNQIVQAKYPAHDGGEDLSHLVLRADDSFSNGYVFSFSTTSANTYIWRRLSSANTVLNASCGGDYRFTSDDIVTFVANGSRLTVYNNNASVCTATDTSITYGRPGVGLGSSPDVTTGNQDRQRLDDVLMFISNTAPTNTTVSINSSLGLNSTIYPLNCFTNLTDVDLDRVNVSVRWYNFSVLHLHQDFNNSYTTPQFFSAQLGVGNLSNGQNWTCAIRFSDGNLTTAFTNSSVLTIIGNAQPVLNKNFLNQTWTVNTNVSYSLNFTNNGTGAGSFVVNVTNLSGATYAYVNQSVFDNVPGGATAYFTLYTSASSSGLYNLSVNVTETGFSGQKDSVLIGTRFLSLGQFSSNSITSVSVTPFDYDKIIIGWCDEDEDDISVGVFNTSGRLLSSVLDVDTNAGNCAANSVGFSVSVSAFNRSSFVIAWYDSNESDITFRVYNASLSPLTSETDVDSDAGVSVAVATSAFNSTAFVVGWYDAQATTNDATFRTYTSSGTAISAETDADTDSGTAANSVDVSAINSTAFVFAWFDDGGNANDASSVIYSSSGTALSSVVDVDGGASNTRAVSVSVLNQSQYVFGWYDNNGNDASYSVRYVNNTQVIGTTDLDGDIGGTGRPVIVSAITQDDFVMSWYDSSTDTGVAAQTIMANSTPISSEISVQSGSLQYHDTVSEEYASDLQLCENAFAVAFANTTTQGIFRTLYPNGTSWNGICPTTVPQITNVIVWEIQDTSAYVNWTTDVEANGTINYGTTLALGTRQGSNFPTRSHSFFLQSLTPSSVYYYNVTSCIDGRCNTTGPHNFTLLAGDMTPDIREPIASQTTTITRNLRYVLNFTNNGTTASNYSVSVTNISGASYITLNQTAFSNVGVGQNVTFEVNISAATAGNFNFSVNITSLLDPTKFDGAIVSSAFLNTYTMSIGSVTSTAVAPLDFNKIIVGWCDDTEDDITIGIFNTTGYLLYPILDVDDTAGACQGSGAGHSVSVSAFDSNRFVVSWYDSVDSNITFRIYNSSLGSLTNTVVVAGNVGASVSTSVSALNSTAFAIGWMDETVNHASVRVYNSAGTSLLAETDVDTDVGDNANSMEVSAINSTAFAVSWFDDGGNANDVLYNVYTTSGTALFTSVQVDTNSANSRGVSVAVANDSTIVVGWTDANNAADSFAIYDPSGNLIVSEVDVDTNSGNGESAKVAAISQSRFAMLWFDAGTDVGVYSQTYFTNGTTISSVVTNDLNTQGYADVGSEEYATGMQICENAFAVSFANLTTQAIWRAYYPNGTIWNGICPTTVPQITNVNVTYQSIINVTFIWNTNVEANSTVNYGTTLGLGTVTGRNIPVTSHSLPVTGLTGSTLYYYNVTSCIDGRCNTTGTYNFTTLDADSQGPVVSLVYPSNNSNITNNLDFGFFYNVSDLSGVSNCSLLIGGTSASFDSTITKDINQSFYQYLTNGTYLWGVSCTDQFGNVGVSANRTVNVNVVPYTFGRRFYETYTSNFPDNTVAVIWLNNSQDSTQNTVTRNHAPITLENYVNATTSVMGANGAVIPRGSVVDFSSSFSSSHANVELTWKVYIANSSGETLLCQNGDDGSGGTPTAGTATGSNTTCINTDVRLTASDRLLYVINGYNTNVGTTRTITHAWDSPTSSFLDINVTTEGFLLTNLTYPTSSVTTGLSQNFNVTCQVTCTIGICRNTRVLIQYNTSSISWTNISSSGNIVLGTGETNPHNLGNLTSTVLSNFSIRGNAPSSNNVRCFAYSTYDYNISSTTRQVTVGGIPLFNFPSPTPASGSILTVDSFAVNMSVLEPSLSNFIWSWQGVNYTLYSSNLKVMYDFNNVSSLGENGTHVRDFSLFSNNATLSGSPVWNSTGKSGGAYQFDGVNDFVSMASPPNVSATGNWTYAFWIKPNAFTNGGATDGSGTYFIDRTTATTPLISFKAISGGYAVQTRYDSGSGLGAVTAANSIQNGNWTYVVVTREAGTAFRIYINGQLNNSGADTGAALTPPTAKIGGHSTACPGVGCFNGTLDEFRIWNISLTASQVAEMYNVSFFRVNQTAWTFYSNRTNLANGVYYYQGNATNTDGFNNASSVRNVTIDTSATSPPVITIISPLATTYTTVSIQFNVSLDIAGSWCGYSLNGAANVSMTSFNTTYFYSNPGGIAQGSNSVIFSCNSTTGFMDSTSPRNFIVDSIAPALTFVSPTPSNGTTLTVSNLTISINISESSLSSFTWLWNNTNFTVFNSSLVVGYNFQNLTSLGESATVVNDFSLYNNDATLSGSPVWNSTGRYGGAYQFDGADDYASMGFAPNLSATGNWTYAFWIKPNAFTNGAAADGAGTYFIDRTTGTNALVSFKAISGGYAIQTRYDDSSGLGAVTAANSIQNGNWTYVVVTREAGTAFRIYINGQLNNSGADTGAALTPPTAKIGGHTTACPGTGCFNGTLDEFRIWNRALTAAEINESYKYNFAKLGTSSWNFFSNKTNLSDGTYNFNSYATDLLGFNGTSNWRTVRIVTAFPAPTITLNLPANNTIVNVTTYSFNFTAVDQISTTLTCNLTAGTHSSLNFAASNGTLTNRQLTFLSDGDKLWNVTCVNEVGSLNVSENRNVSVKVPPTVVLNTANNTFFNSTSFALNYTPNDNTGLAYCDFYLDGVFNDTDDNMQNGTQNSFNINGINEGAHVWSVACNDTIQLRTQSENRTFTVDTDGLNILLLNPENGTDFFTLTVDLSFNATDNIDTNLDCNVTVNSQVVNRSSVTSGSITNRTIIFLTGGTKFWNVTCQDDALNTETSETRNFTIELGPTVTLGDPQNNTYRNFSNIDFNYDVSDPNDNLANSTLILNGLINQTNQSALVNDATNDFNVTLSDGYYNWTVNVTDLTNIVGSGIPPRLLVIDTHQPSIILNYPPNETTVGTNNVTINYTAFDNMDLNLTCNVSIDESPTVVNIDSLNGTDVITYVIRQDGSYFWNVNCIDHAGNNNYSETRNFTVEAPPNVSLQSPTNEYTFNTTNLSFIYFPEDAIGIANCSLFIDGILNDSDTVVSANQNNSFIVNNIQEGRHNWTVQCFDAFPDFNGFTASLRNFTVDVTLPNVTLNSPFNGTNTLSTTEFNISVVDNLDFDGILQCNLYVDSSLNQSNFNITNGSSAIRTVMNLALGQHTWNASCVDDATNRGWTQNWQFNVTYADLMVNETSIVFNATNPTENESVMVNATIYSLSDVITRNITVSFYEGNPDSGGILIGANQTISVLSGLSSTTVNVTWSAKLGTTYIFVVVDPPFATNGSIREWNESNNKVNKSITTGAWQFVFGDINSESYFEIAGILNRSLVRWESVNFNSGRIYVADSESSISWMNLQALGKNTTDGNATNDFAEVDTLLNMTGFYDSIVSLYTNGGSASNLTSYYVFNRLIDEIPITNSTNNTNFMTGILWDTSDDSNGQFDTSQKEDLIFSTALNIDQPGAYGIYDYEMRIPARLREYITADSRRVVYYTEIN